MRILLLTQWFDPEPSFKGLTFAKELAKRGDTVEVLTGFPNYPGGKLYPGYRLRPWRVEWMDGFPVCRVPLYPSHDRSAVRRILNYATFAVASAVLGPALVHRPDVIYAYHPPGTIGLPALVLRRWFSVPIVYDVQDLWPDTISATGMLSNQTIMRLLDRFCRFVYRKADRLVVLSPGFQKTMIERGVSRDRIKVIHNWAPEQVAASTDSEPRPASRARESFRVVFAGMMGMAQALDAVLDAAAQCAVTVPQAHFVFVGAGVDRSRLEQRARQMGLTNVEFVAMQPLSAMKAIFAEADALLVHLKDDPLFTITIPCKTQAYMAAGRPIIMAVRGDAADLVTRAGAGVLADPGDAGSIADAVRRLASLSPQERARMGAAGRAFYERELAIGVAVQEFQKIFDAVTETHTATGAPTRLRGKRALDIAGSVVGLVLFAPVLALTALAVRLAMGRPVLFKQDRPGLNGRSFGLLKFRTMSQATDAAGVPLPDDQRLTRLGRLLRRASLDELPQLWNVLRGEMSLVGPRPLLPKYLRRYSDSQMRRHDVKPGITGWAQVNGRNAVTWDEKFELDVWYVDNQSHWLDIKILWLTLARVFRGADVSQAGHATMPEFLGSSAHARNENGPL